MESIIKFDSRKYQGAHLSNWNLKCKNPWVEIGYYENIVKKKGRSATYKIIETKYQKFRIPKFLIGLIDRIVESKIADRIKAVKKLFNLI